MYTVKEEKRPKLYRHKTAEHFNAPAVGLLTQILWGRFKNLIKRNIRADKPLQKLLTDGKVTTSKKVTGTNYKFVTVPKKDFQVFVTAYDASGNTVSSKIITVKV